MSSQKSGPSEYMILTSKACMPNSCWGRYRNVAVLEVDPGAQPKMISERARGVRRIVWFQGKLHAGSESPRTAYGKALAYAQELVDSLSLKRDLLGAKE